MSGAQQATGVVAAATSLNFSVTIANNAGTPGRYGFADEITNPGAISPTTLNGVNIIRLSSDSGAQDLLFALTGILAQSFFHHLTIQDTLGNWTNLSSSGATFTSGVGRSTWRWGTSGLFPYWTATTPSPRSVIFFL